MANRNSTNGALAALKKLFTSAPRTPVSHLPLSSGHNVISRSGLATLMGKPGDTPGELTTEVDSLGIGLALPEDRLAKYPILEEMSKSATVSSALNIHIAHALSTSKRSGLAFTLVAKNPADKEAVARCNELMEDLGEMINAGLPGWGLLMSIFGVGFTRPYGEPGRGIVNIESSYYTLPHFIQEFTRGGQLAGFTGDYLLTPDNLQRTLAEPWFVVPVKNPYWTPSRNQIPMTTGTRGYTLMNDAQNQDLMETQNYGTSFLEHSYEPFMNLCGALNALKATRYNAAKIDRLIALTTGTLDPINAGNYTRGVSQSLKRNAETLARRSMQASTMPTVLNHLRPVMGDGKNGITIDTQYIPAINAAQRAQWLRQGSQDAILRFVDIHLAYKHGKIYLPNQRPFTVQFNSMNTALMAEEARDQDARANFISIITQILDQIQQSPKLAGSDTFMRYLFCDQLKMDPQTLQKMLAEFKATPAEHESDDEDMMNESAPDRHENPEQWSRTQLINFAKFVMSQN